MDAFPTRHSFTGLPKRLLLPISFGASSVALLDLLHRRLKWQLQRSGRTGFTIHVLHVYDDTASTSDHGTERLAQLKFRYPDSEYSLVSMSSIYDASVGNSNTTNGQGTTNEDSLIRLHKLLSSVNSSSSKTDILGIFLRRVVVQFTKLQELDGVLWGDSTTKLAEKVLSESSKGRGYSLPWSVTDGETPFDVLFHFPLREVLKKEIAEYVKLTDPPLTDLIFNYGNSVTHPPVSSKSMTIDLLASQYFDSVETNYPSIVSNVVRTSTKLEASVVSLKRCKLCKFPVTNEQLGHDNWEGLQHLNISETKNVDGLCYGCSRTISADLISLLPE
jgi:cytoplasmic tRNA 2-thiolation protein 2